MFKLDVVKAAIVIILGEAIAHYEVLHSGALMFGGRRAYEEGKFIIVKKGGAYIINPFDRGADVCITDEFYRIVNSLEEANSLNHIEARRKFAQMCREEKIGEVGTPQDDVVRSILREKMMFSLSWQEIENILSVYAPWRMECHSRGFLPKEQKAFLLPDVPEEDLPF